MSDAARWVLAQINRTGGHSHGGRVPPAMWSTRQAESLRVILMSDVSCSMAAAITTFCEGLRSLEFGCYRWACIKLYYSVYYSLRAWLESADEVHFWRDNKPYYSIARSGEVIHKGRGNSHSLVFYRFQQRFPNQSILSQDIDMDKPLDWIRSWREKMQYLNSGHFDPCMLEVLREWEKVGSRNILMSALSVDENSSQYSSIFDSDYAIIAFPARVFHDTLVVVRGQRGDVLSDNVLVHCRKICRVPKNRLSTVVDLMTT